VLIIIGFRERGRAGGSYFSFLLITIYDVFVIANRVSGAKCRFQCNFVILFEN
jgi:hypothetical protein